MGGNVTMLFAQELPDLLEKIIIVDIIPKKYKPHHKNIMDALKSIDFKKKKSRKEVDDHLSNYIEDERIRQFLLKNLYWMYKERWGLESILMFYMSLKIIYHFSFKII